MTLLFSAIPSLPGDEGIAEKSFLPHDYKNNSQQV